MMLRRTMAVLTVLVMAGSVAWAKTFVVTRAADSGKGTLRWAITQANTRPSDDTIIFDPGLLGARIRPLSQLPTLTDPGTVINGDIDGDGDPDVELSGARAGKADQGLRVTQPTKTGCTIQGLSITDWGGVGIYIHDSDYNVVVGCHLGVELDGSTLSRNGGSDIYIARARYTRIGGPSAAERNVFAGGTDGAGVQLYDNVDRTRILANYFGIKRDGSGQLGSVLYTTAIEMGTGCADNQVGGSTMGQGNVFAGFDTGVHLAGAQTARNTVKGNYFGLLPDGNKQATINSSCVTIDSGSHANIIGGTTAGARNVFSSRSTGISIADANTRDNVVKGNYFGVNATGTARREMYVGMHIEDGAGPQTIGGSPTSGGNFFCPTDAEKMTTYGILFETGGGDGTLVRGNTFGERPDGAGAGGDYYGIYANGATPEILDNKIIRAYTGVVAKGPGSLPRIFGNTFRRCYTAVHVHSDGNAILGNLSNGDSTDDGRNVFKPSNTISIYNGSPLKIKAEGNSFGTTVASEIEDAIVDKKDNPGLGRIDYDPLRGGTIPSGGTVGVAGLVAVPTAIGAEVMFTLTAAADVEARVLNLAGRPVGTICRSRACEAGANTLMWSGRSDAGLRAPAGRYLIEVTARGDDGEQARAVAPVSLSR